MYNQGSVTFQEALDTIETLPEYQQEDIINIIQHRLIEHKREKLAKNIKHARKEYNKGNTKIGTVDDLMNEVSK